VTDAKAASGTTAPDTTTAEPAAADGLSVPSSEPQFSWRKVAVIVLAGLLVALSVAALVLWLQLRAAAQEQDAREEALRYATQTAKNLTSISYEALDADIDQVLDSATGQFREDFAERSDNLREVLTTNKVVSEGEVLEAALVNADEDSATALVVVDATVQNTQNPEGGATTYRMKLELERQGDQWLASMLEFVG
jgi:Mce-associated membrane protein